MRFYRACALSVALAAVFMVAGVPAGAETVLLDFYGEGCPPCRTMAPIVDHLSQAGHPVRKVNVRQDPQLAHKFNVQSIPCFVMLADGEEVDRVVGMTTYARLERMLQTAQQKIAARDSRNAAGRDASTPWQAESQRSDGAGELAGSSRSQRGDDSFRTSSEPRFDGGSPSHNRFGRQDGMAASSASVPRSPSPRSPGSMRSSVDERRAAIEQAVAATVRLKVEDESGFSFGTGTVVDYHESGDFGREALVLTCAHIFRDSRGRGPIRVDLFRGDRHHTVPGKLLAWNLETDVALVVIQPDQPLVPARVAPPGHRYRPGERMLTVGCPRGMPPESRDTRIASINRYLGSDNIQIDGQPVDGCSGGGLFTTDGLLVGVCNGADARDDQGLYRALPVIQSELDEADLSFVYQRRDDGERIASHEPDRADTEPASRGGDFRLSSHEQTVVETMRRAGDRGLVFVVPPQRDGQSSRPLIVENPSPTLLSQMREESRSRTASTPSSNRDDTDLRIAGTGSGPGLATLPR